jgi:Fic-DOC domain mobile mystery protein B
MVSKFPFEYAPGATPLDPDEMSGLIPKYISTQSELNLLEQENILKAQSWLQKKKSKEILDEAFIRDLHKQMFKNVWKWAGKFRSSGKNIGTAWEKIPQEIKVLCDDTKYWVENKTYGWDELAVRFHHRLVFIHAFANGNGRHARLMTDLLLEKNGQEPFSWGSKQMDVDLTKASDVRNQYIAALREADERRYEKLLAFARS